MSEIRGGWCDILDNQTGKKLARLRFHVDAYHDGSRLRDPSGFLFLNPADPIGRELVRRREFRLRLDGGQEVDAYVSGHADTGLNIALVRSIPGGR